MSGEGAYPRQIQQYQDEGFLIIRDLIGPKVIQPLIGELEQSVNDAAHEAIERGLLTQTAYPNASFPARLALMSASCSDPDFLWSRIEGKRHKTAGMLFSTSGHCGIIDWPGNTCASTDKFAGKTSKGREGSYSMAPGPGIPGP